MTSPAVSLPADLPEILRPEVVHSLEALAILRESLPDTLPRILAASPFVARQLVRRPELLVDLPDSGDLDCAYAPGMMRTRVAVEAETEEALMATLRRARNREMVRIAWRDLADHATLDETLGDLTDLAEAVIDVAHDWHLVRLAERHGAPRDAEGRPLGLGVIGMGKLGGRELNYSSDIDLIFVYAEDGETDGERPIDHHTFFTRLGQKIVRTLNEPTADGFVFRVDMRLRPFGDAGPLVMSSDAAEGYYQTHGREWERYAFIKARAVGGDRATAGHLLESLSPFVWRRYLDYGALAELRDMKRLINREAVRKGLVDDIKRGEGGIREVEFIGQAFQLIRGGRDASLRLRGIRDVLARLGEIDILPGWAVSQLREDYEFLRRTENRLQAMEDRQTHRLPDDDLGRARLAFAMGFADWDGFRAGLARRMRRVHAQFEQVFAAPQKTQDEESEDGHHALEGAWFGSVGELKAGELIGASGYAAPAAIIAALDELRESAVVRSLSATGRQRLDSLMPLLIAACGETSQPDEALKRTLELVRTIARRSVYLALLAESPMALSQLVRLCAASPWIAGELTRHPILLDELLDPRALYAPPDKAGVAAELAEELAQVPADDLEQVMDRLRAFKQMQVLRVAAADVVGALPVMKVSDHLTWIAEVLLDAVLAAGWRQIAARHGVPAIEGGLGPSPGFAVIGYGKLGGIELGYGSDLDIVFLYDAPDDAVTVGGERPLDVAEFYARLAQRCMHLLGARTPAGILYEVDTRLRPSGASGLLVSSLATFERYQTESAWTWEHQALVRARPVAGDLRVGEAFGRIRALVLARSREHEGLRREVREMREKMWAELASRDATQFDLKRDPGGIADIEFMVQYLVLAHAAEHPRLVEFPDNIRILDGLAACDLLSAEDAGFLADAYRTFRDRIHALTLQGQSSAVPATEYAEDRERVRGLWRRLMGA